jgi:hypothetical protein
LEINRDRIYLPLVYIVRVLPYNLNVALADIIYQLVKGLGIVREGEANRLGAPLASLNGTRYTVQKAMDSFIVNREM